MAKTGTTGSLFGPNHFGQGSSPLLSDSDETYAQEFLHFVGNTNQKSSLIEHLMAKVIPTCRSHNTYLDIGAGEGTITSAISPTFQQTIAIEPNEVFARMLNLRGIYTHTTKFEDWRPIVDADFVLLSHVSYYFAVEQYRSVGARISRCMADMGVLCVAVQDESSPFCVKNEEDPGFLEYLRSRPEFQAVSDNVVASTVCCELPDMQRIAMLFSEALGCSNVKLQTVMDCSQRVVAFQYRD